MEVRNLGIDAFVFTPHRFGDARGMFVAPFQELVFSETIGHSLRLAQTNHSVSRSRTIRGVHFADVPPGQAKYVYCPRGALLDVIVDVRVGSPTYGRSESVHLDDAMLRAVYIAEGLGHAFMALTDDTVMAYMCSTSYNPSGERGITPLDPTLELPWPDGVAPILSEKDQDAPTLSEAERLGILPEYHKCAEHYERLRRDTEAACTGERTGN